MRHFRMLVWILILVPVSLHGEPPEPQQNSGTKLHRVFSDDFSRDSLSDYQLLGKVAWETGILKLPEGSSVSRLVELGSRVVVRAELQFPTLTKDGDQSLTMLRIELDGNTSCLVGWQQTREKEKTLSKVSVSSKVLRFFLPKTTPIRDVTVSGPLESGDWWIEYRRGLLRIGRSKETVLAGYIENDTAMVRGIAWLASRSEFRLRRLAVDGLNRPAPLTESQQKSAADAAKKDTQFLQLYRQGRFAEATKLGEAILEIRRKVLGVEHPDYAGILNNLASSYLSQGEYAKAEPLLLEARDINKHVLGVEHPGYASNLNNLAGLYGSQGKSAKAEPLYLEARDIRKRVLGVEHPDYAMSLYNLAGLYQSQGKYAKAKPLYLEARDIYKRVLGADHPYYAASLNNLAALYNSQGEYAKAEPLYLESRDIRKRVLGVEHPGYADSLHNLALLYKSQGEYAKAEPLLLEARDITKRVQGVEHPDYATSLAMLALLYLSQGEHAKAEPLLLEARDIQKRVLGVDHPDYTSSLNNLALLYNSQGEYAKAEPLLLEARDIEKRVLGVDHPDYASSLNNLALLYNSQGEYAKAEPLFLEARDITKRVQGVDHPDYAASLNNLAGLYGSQGKSAKAEPLLLEARDITKRVQGVEHPDYALSLNNLASLYLSQGEHAKAEPLFRESLKLSRDLIERNAVGQSQSTQLKYATTLRYHLDTLLSHGLASSTAGTGLFDEILSWKGMTLVRQRKYRLAGEQASTRPILEALTVASRQLTAVLRKTPTPNTQKAWRQQVAALSEKRDRLEAELVAASPELQQASERLTTEDLLETLPEDTVLVDFLSFNFWQRVPKDDYHVLESQQHVLASILRNGRPVEFVNLGPETAINEAVNQWRTVFLSRDPDDAARVEPAGRKLRQRIWEPLLPYLKDAKTVILCPDGALGRVAFVALPGREKGSYLIEDHRLACVPVPQLLPALFRKASAEQRPAGDVLLIGDVDYSADTKEQAAPKKRKRSRGSEELFRDVAFGPLDETAGEIAAIRDLFFELFDAEPNAVKTLRKQQATESAFRQYAGQYETLHIATHGFFADASKKSAEHSATEDNRAGSRSGLFGQNDNALTHVRGFHPGMLSGLALAGANHAPEADGDDDGILTADEISFLRLEGVDLVVLSACETGLGEVAGGEGLLGVQRAFQVSGARSVLASLWKVDDVATRRLMDRFYRNLWDKDKEMTRLDALREAQLWMLRNPGSIEGSIVRGSLVRLKKPAKPTSPKPDNTTGRTNPRFWAAFTLSGDWR